MRLNSMRALLGASVLALCALFAGAELRGPYAADAQAPAAAACGNSGPGITYLCGLPNVEDMGLVPGQPFVLAASYGLTDGTTSLSLVSTDIRAITPLPVTVAPRPDRMYAACPSALNLAQFRPHGIAIRQGARGRHTLYVVNHGGRESIEIFALDARTAHVQAQWIGCVVLPAGASGNAVAPLPDGGFVATKFFDTARGSSREQFLGRQTTGVAYRWSPRTGLTPISGTEAIGDNGVELSADGRWLFVTSWIEKKVIRLPLDGAGATVAAPIDFLPDNIKRAPDGSMLVTGQATSFELIAACHHARCPGDWGVARLNPETMQVSYLYWEKGTAAFAGATTALQVGDKLWIGTFRGDRIAIADLPSAPLP